MRGRRVFADVPHTPDPTRWADPLLLASNLTLYALARVVAPTSKVTFREPFVTPDEIASGRPRIYITWHRMNYLSMAAFETLPPDQRPTIVVHDGIASRAFSHQSSVWLGYEVFVFRRRSPVSPREQIARYMRESGRSILNLPDSGGPYGRMKPGILEVARAANALIVPFVVLSKPNVTVGKTLKHALPLPFSTFECRRAAALDSTTSVEECQSALDTLA